MSIILVRQTDSKELQHEELNSIPPMIFSSSTSPKL